MLKTVLRGLMEGKVRLALTVLSVVLAVSFVSGAFILGDSINDAFAGLLEEGSANTDVVIRTAVDFEGMQSFEAGTIPPMDEALLDEVAAVDGVDKAVGWVEDVAQFIDRDGNPIGGMGPPTIGLSWIEFGSPLTLDSGEVPAGPGEVVIDRSTATRFDYAVGDEIDIVLPGGLATYEVVGISVFGTSDNMLGATLASFELAHAQEVFGRPGLIDNMAAVADDGVSPSVLRDRIRTVLGDGYEVLTAEEENASAMEDIQSFTSIISNVLLGFAFVALFVGGFIIVNTFSITVAQRTREFALLRAIGAGSAQIRHAVLLEALLIGAVASVLGILAGVGFSIGLKGLLNAIGFGLPTGGLILATRTIVFSLVVGIGVTVVAALLPARRAGRVSPVEAMRDGAAPEEHSIHRRLVVGGVVTGLGVTLLLVGLGGAGLPAIGAGAVGTLLGVTLIAPALAGPVGRVLGTLPARLGAAGKLADGNVQRDTRRAAVTGSALMVGLALVSFAAVFATSAKSSFTATIEEQFASDVIVTPGNQFGFTLPEGVYDTLSTDPNLQSVTRVSMGEMEVDGNGRFVNGTDVDTVRDVAPFTIVEGDITTLGLGEVFVDVSTASDIGVAVGDTLEATFADTGTQTLTVAGLHESNGFVDNYVLSAETFAANFVARRDAVVLANAADGLEPAEALDAVEEAMAAFPNVSVQDQVALREQVDGQINQMLGFIYMMLAFAIIIALIGITNTLALAVFERTREIGLLRAVGMTRRQVRSMVRWEASIVAVFGALLGAVVGTFFGWAVVQELAEDGFSLTVPFGQLLAFLVLAALAGVLAALFPARRAAKLNVLEAVTHE